MNASGIVLAMWWREAAGKMDNDVNITSHLAGELHLLQLI